MRRLPAPATRVASTPPRRRFALPLLALCGMLASRAWAQDLPDDAALQLADQAAPTAKTATRAWRIYGEAAYARGWLGSPGLSGTTAAAAPGTASTATHDNVRGSLDLRYDASDASGWRTVLSDRLDLVRDEDLRPREHNVNTLREAYVSLRATPELDLDLGRVNIRHGAAWGYNPTDFFRGGALRYIVSPDPALLRENRMGVVVAQAQQVWAGSSLSAAFAPRLANSPSDATASLDLGATNSRNRWLLVGAHKFSDQFNPQVLLFGGESTSTQGGINLSSLLNDATVVFVEYAAGRGPTLIQQSLGLPASDAWRQRAALGATYTTGFNLSLTAEADFNTAAPDSAQWNALQATPGGALQVLQSAQTLQELPVRRGAFFYATWRDAFVRRLDLSGFVRADLISHSRQQWAETRYHFDTADLALQYQLYSGSPSSAFGMVPQRRTIEASARFYF